MVEPDIEILPSVEAACLNAATAPSSDCLLISKQWWLSLEKDALPLGCKVHPVTLFAEGSVFELATQKLPSPLIRTLSLPAVESFI